MKFVREIFSEPDGHGSSNRVCVVAIVVVLLSCVAYIVYMTGALPVIPEQFVSLIEWLVSVFLFGNVAKNGITALAQGSSSGVAK